MKKLKLKALDLGAKELLSREQLKNILGGDGSDDGGSTGISDGCAADKVAACKDKNEGNSCCFYYQGHRYDGLCRKYAPNYVNHCSDLN
ncbi:hypothetical protein CLV59_108149 [Chitinophaga dinghuensis]|uniref:Natural product n=1 Tax=Chitinophaga dinghuensis TaxID=1539050 RepID=A0A327VRF4_9BACT|nr:hypothetical protein [Chitinophaga dinghuensis]RAJ76630.1 hypothetical protein CLV59_108149 [Chitinophaga dinghuensis]